MAENGREQSKSGRRRRARWARVLLWSLLGGVLVAGLWAGKRLHLRSRVVHWWQARIAVAEPKPFRWPNDLTVRTWIYRGGLVAPFRDWGWSGRAPGRDGALRVALADYGGIRFAGESLEEEYGGLTFRYRAPRLTGRIAVQLDTAGAITLPRLTITSLNERTTPDGWVEVFVPVMQLNPDGHAIGHVVIAAAQALPGAWLELADVGLTVAEPVKQGPPRSVVATVRCEAPTHPINPHIYGIGMAQDKPDDGLWWSGASIRRWGGNPTSRYNWKLGNAWNTGSDWFFENVDYVGEPGYSYRTFLDNNTRRGLDSALTLPLIGWVAKDVSSSAFPRAAYPVQDAFDGWREQAGSGVRGGVPIVPGAPTRTSVAASPAFVGAWVAAIRAHDQKVGRRSVHQYILDNEPNLWSDTHRDVHPEPLTYDELLDRTIRYATAVRAADPEAVIAGPAEWGWSNYFFSAKDAATKFKPPLDRLQHGMTALVPWYLQKLREHERATSVRLLDVLDLHFYPEGVYNERRDRATAALRLRSTRSLWDPSYREESWIGEPVQLLPRMRAWVDENYPGLGISIGEWNFGGEQHVTGALAVAEVLGRFAEYRVASAYYWTYPPAGSPAAWAFRAYRNFDDAGAKFEALFVPTNSTPPISLFASRSHDARRWVFVALNFDPARAATLRVQTERCVPTGRLRAFGYEGGAAGWTPREIARDPAALRLSLPAYGLAVIEVVAGP